jgi:hypothetical protein
MPNFPLIEKTPKNPIRFRCDICDFNSHNKKDYSKHLATAKHKRLITPTELSPKKPQKTPMYNCICGKKYKHMSSLCSHKNKCKVKDDGSIVIQTEEIDKRDELIEQLVNSNTEMRTLVMVMLEKYQDSQLHNQEATRQNQENTVKLQETTANLVNKVIEVMPQMGNTTNNNTNNTLNFYLTNTCKDAESIHEFTERFVERIVNFFRDNYREVAYKQINLPENVRDIFFQCLDENPQTKSFVQTTDLKNGVVYIKEKKKDENYKLHGEAEFVKYMDGFQNAGLRIGHAINCGLLPCKSQCHPVLERDFGEKPRAEDYADDDEDEQYEKDMDRYREKVGAIRENILIQMINAMNIFDNKHVRENTLLKTKRLKIGDA